MIITILVTNQQNAQAASFEVSDENVFDRCNGATGKIATILKSEQDSDGKNLRIKIPDSHPHQDNARVLTVSGEQMLGIFQAMGMFQFKEQRQELLMQPAITLEGLAEIHALIRQTIDIENPKDAAWVMDRVIFLPISC